MKANELCQRTAECLIEMGIAAPVVPADERNVLFLTTPEPCIVVCRARLRARTGVEILTRAGTLPVLLVQNEKQIEQLVQLLSFAAEDPEVDLFLSSLAMWRAV